MGYMYTRSYSKLPDICLIEMPLYIYYYAKQNLMYTCIHVYVFQYGYNVLLYIFPFQSYISLQLFKLQNTTIDQLYLLLKAKV